MESMKEEYTLELTSYKEKLERIQADLDKKEIKIKQLTQDFRNTCLANLSMLEEREKLEGRLRFLEEENEKFLRTNKSITFAMEDK